MLFHLFRKKKKRNLKVPARLSSEEKKQIKKVIDNAKKSDDVPHSAQESVTFERMFPSGICREEGDFYSKTIQFQDINYKLAQDEDKTIMFEEWCSFLNFFDSSVEFVLTFLNVSTDATAFEKSIRIPLRKDGFNVTRDQYSNVLKRQLEKGNNGLTKTKYLTFGIHASSIREAKPRLNHIEIDIMNNFKHLGVMANTLNGKERLKLMHDIFHMGDDDRFMFDWKWCSERGLGPKDFIVPSSFAFQKKKSFEMGDMYCAMSFLSITASEINDEMLADFLSMDSSQVLSIHMQSIDQNQAIKNVKRKITELNAGRSVKSAFFDGLAHGREGLFVRDTTWISSHQILPPMVRMQRHFFASCSHRTRECS